MIKDNLSDNNIDQYDLDNLKKTFQTSELLKNLGFTRDTLRYYEEIGLISPDKDSGNNYRKFTFDDIYSLLGIEFYKKRGLTLAEAGEVIQSMEFDRLDMLLKEKEELIAEEINKLREKMNRISETRDFIANLDLRLNQFMLRKLPLFEVRSTFLAGTALHEYGTKVISCMNVEEEDILSNMVRRITFDGHGYKESEMYIVSPSKKKEKGRKYLYRGECVYTVVESGRVNDADNSVNINTLAAAVVYCKDKGLKLKGEVYLFSKLILFKDGVERMFIEAWAPIEKQNK